MQLTWPTCQTGQITLWLRQVGAPRQRTGLASAGLFHSARSPLPGEHRKSKARKAAHAYAPKPEGSSLTYGVVAAVTTLLAIICFGMFYRADVLSSPVTIGAVLAVVFVMGMVLRRRRKRLHSEAYEQELDRHDNSPPTE